MKVTVSYISSKFDINKTIEKIDASSADAIHVDLMDGKYVPNSNFDIKELPKLFLTINKPLDIHLMTENPEQYLDTLFKLNTDIIFFHPSTTDDPIKLIEDIQNHNRRAGIVINPNEDIKDFIKYLETADAVLIMSVTPGKGGQQFLKSSLVNYELIKEQKKYYFFELYVDGGINDETVDYVKDANGVISGSFICNSDDFESQINKLKK